MISPRLFAIFWRVFRLEFIQIREIAKIIERSKLLDIVLETEALAK